MHGLLRYARPVRDDPQLFIAHFPLEPHIRQRRRQPDLLTKPVHLVDELLWLPRQNQPHLHPDRHLLPVHERVALIKLRQPVVHGVRGAEPAALEADAAQQRVRLDDALEVRRRNAGAGRDDGAAAAREQGLVAELRESHRGEALRVEVPRAARGVGRLGDAAGVRLEVGAQGVAHAGDDEPRRRLCDDGGVEQDHVGVARQVEVALHRARLGVNHRARRRRSIRRRQRRHNDNRRRQRRGNRLRRVQRLPPAEPDHRGDPRCRRLRGGDEAVDLRLRGLAAEEGRGDVGDGEGGEDGVGDELVGDEEAVGGVGGGGEGGDEGGEEGEGAGALDVAGGEGGLGDAALGGLVHCRRGRLG
mmetsp:Transcript_26062/g.65147  ORF Transcript_26062/g.65147 Transcript_26062/m.65147 type:complete len:359 (-) Transcript_26062:155-1231(-)